jgi:predicted CoA-binding protein
MDVARMPEPRATEGSSRQDLLRIYEQTKSIAIVGASANGHKAAHMIPTYVQSQRYRIIPVNPKAVRSSASASIPPWTRSTRRST